MQKEELYLEVSPDLKDYLRRYSFTHGISIPELTRLVLTSWMHLSETAQGSYISKGIHDDD